jgi:DNA replication and repair protein RecF
VLRVVLFAPEDTRIVRGDPADRRRFLDDVLAQRRPAFAAARGEYERVLRQRNRLLKQARTLTGSSREAAVATLEDWTRQLVEHGAQITAARIAAVRALAAPVDRFYRELADREEPVELTYLAVTGTSVVGSEGGGVPEREPIARRLRECLEERAGDELARGMTLVGPHRDDLELTIGTLPARTHASHGEVWSLALALKLATEEILGEVGDRPVVLLDDVFAELDTTRRTRLAKACAAFDQVLVTAAVEEDVPLEGARLDVRLEEGTSSVRRRGEEA